MSALPMSRRTLLGAAPAVLLASRAAKGSSTPRIAAVVTEYRKYSHAQNIVDRFLEGFGWEGRHYHPSPQVVSLYVDQVGENDLSRERAARIPGLRIYPSIAEALTLGGETLAGALRAVAVNGSVAACGIAGGGALATHVAPFILRGVNLLGINSVLVPYEERLEIWRRLAQDLPKPMLESIIQEAALDDVFSLADQILSGQVKGRLVIRVGKA